MPRKLVYTGEPVCVTVELARRQDYVGIVRLTRQLTIDQVDDHRQDDCDNYEKCLEHASAHQWPSWSCMLCDGKAGLRGGG